MKQEHEDCEWLRMTEIIPGKHESLNGRRLRAVLLTTYEQPDPDVLVEEFLPQWLGMERGAADLGTDENERLAFYWELDRRLQPLRGHFAIFSSSRHELSERNHWLWRYVRLLSVGRKVRATQHSKLWMFHWGGIIDPEKDAPKSTQELLQIVISSTNLTSDALKGQIQAGWSAVLTLEPRHSEVRLKQWGILPGYLRALGQSSGEDGERHLHYWKQLLTRAEPPPGAVFVASVPGKHDRATLRRRATAWGAAGLASVDLRGKAGIDVSVLVPTVGNWQRKDLVDWQSWLGGKCGLRLAWPGNSHPWSEFWQMPPGSQQTLRKAGVSLLSLPATVESGGSHQTAGKWASPFHAEHRQADPRWCHAKLYRFRRGNGTRLLITSANFSPAAWGRLQPDGKLEIENFELGVLLRNDYGHLDELDGLAWDNVRPSDPQEKPEEGLVIWADAFWNGLQICIECRVSTDVKLERSLAIRCTGRGAGRDSSKSKSTSWMKHWDSWSTSVEWPDGMGIPEVATLKATGNDTEVFEVLVSDNRQPDTNDPPMIPVLARADLKALELRLLEEDYGGGFADQGDGGNLPTANTSEVVTTTADYGIPAIETARRRWRVIDTWVERYQNARRWAAEPASLMRDARRLQSLWETLAVNKSMSSAERVSARAAASEMAFRIKELSK
jgi:hypothetical protein